MNTIAEMLKENTGTHMLDSGGIYGRNWERNQARDFDKEVSTSLSFSVYAGSNVSVEVTHNVYHWLNERCELAENLDKLFDSFAELEDNEDKGWLQLMVEFPEWLASEHGYDEPAGIYGEGEPFTVNTYNHQSLLSQTLQFHYFCNNEGEFIALQIHGGCDVRGGYTRPRIFTVGNMSELDIFEDQRATVYCTGKDHLPGANVDADNEGHNWNTDDGACYYFQGSSGLGAGTQLQDYEGVDLDDLEDGEEVKWEEGKLFIKDGDGYCPHCGAKLAAST